MQTILGSGGAIGIELAKELANYTDKIRLASRHPVKINNTDEILAANLLNREEVFNAVEGSDVVYLLVGLRYSYNVWKKEWPVIIQNVIDACIKNKSKLVFFDNIYMIDRKSLKHITEESPINPSSKKGMIRAELDKQIIDRVEKGNLEAIIARSADFYGPMKDRSMLVELVLKNMIKGKKAQWQINAKVKHSFTYYTDAARGTAILGNTEDAYNQIWNLPTNNDPLTGEEWIKLFANELSTSDKYQLIPAWMLKMIGFFIPVMKELYEMSYQYSTDYYFDSNKFNNKFNYQPVSNIDGVRETIALYKL